MSDSSHTTVLYIDSAADRQERFQALLTSVFGDTLRLLPADSADILSRIAVPTQPDCIIAAMDTDAEASSKALSHYVAGVRLPIIALIPGSDETTGLRAMHGGADDFLMYDGVTEAQIRRAVINAVRIKALRAEALRLQREGEHHSLDDPLTGLAARKLFHDRLSHSMVLAARAQQSIAVMVVSLSHLKDINSMQGTEAGDDALLEAATRLRQCLRQADTVARISGRKFGVLLETGATYEGMNIAARKIIDAMDIPFRTEQGPLDISVEIGIVLFPDHGEDVDNLMHNAETAMAEANRRGGGFVVFAYDDMLSGFYDSPQAG